MKPLTRKKFVALRKAGIAGAYGYDTAALCAMQAGDWIDANVMLECERNAVKGRARGLPPGPARADWLQ